MNALRHKLPDPESFLPTRQSLIDRLKDWDDDESWRDFFYTYWKFIYSVAIKAGLGDAAAQDVVQQAIIDVSRHMPGFQYDPAKGSFKGWLCQLTHWRISDQLRKRQREEGRHADLPSDTGHADAIENIPDPAFVAPSSWDEEWERNLVDAAIQRVKKQVQPRHFQMFDLYVLKNLPIARVTAALGVTMGQVHLAKHRITALIKKEVQKLETQH